MLKPFSIRTVSEALQKFHELKSNLTASQPRYDAILELLQERKKQSSVLVYQNDKILPIRMDTIALFFIENEITYILTLNQQQYSINKTLEELEQMAGSSFFRANRQFLVNRKAIVDTSQYFSRKLALNLSVKLEERITISKTKVTEFLNWLSEN